MICLENGKEKEMDLQQLLDTGRDKTYLCLLTLDEFTKADLEEEIKEKILGEFHENVISKFENHDTFDLVYLSLPPQLANEDNVRAFSAYISKHLLIAVYMPWEDCKKIPDIAGSLNKNFSPVRSLIYLLDVFTRKDSRVLQDIEEEITDLEDTLITAYDKKYINDIVAFRKKLLALKRYYEQLVDLFDELSENENSFLDISELKYCGNIANRVDRLHHTVLNLRDYVTQVREAYQSQVDINLNVIMKVFTVVTTIFLPLSLVAGWYGMNLKMPEYSWDYGYPIIASFCVLIVVFCIILFKKNKWF